MNNKLTVTEIDISLLTPYETNPRVNEKAVDYVVESIANFGFKVPIIVDANNVIICGHTRYKAALRLNMDTVACIVATDLTQAQTKAFRIADNKVSEYSKWDEDLLRQELEALEGLDVDMSSLGFQEWEIDQLLNPLTIDDLGNFFVDKDAVERKKKRIICPLCKGEFEL